MSNRVLGAGAIMARSVHFRFNIFLFLFRRSKLYHVRALDVYLSGIHTRSKTKRIRESMNNSKRIKCINRINSLWDDWKHQQQQISWQENVLRKQAPEIVNEKWRSGNRKKHNITHAHTYMTLWHKLWPIFCHIHNLAALRNVDKFNKMFFFSLACARVLSLSLKRIIIISINDVIAYD